MIKLKIDNIEYEVAEGVTIREVAKKACINIPVLCHNNNLPHFSSCMVCMVKDKRNGNFLPSCSALVQNNMDIDASSEEVLNMRRKAVELLLSEHRAECEAPCKLVCPGGYNIPLMNRLLQTKKIDEAVKLSARQIKSLGLKCHDCPGYCENACRRKKIDTPVSIKNLHIFVSQMIEQESLSMANSVEPVAVKEGKQRKRFTSHTGKIETSELQEWLKECTANNGRIREIYDSESASSEAANCMHCDCRASEDCKLRNLADLLSVKDPRGKSVNSPIQKKINKKTGLIFENAKCIKCGLCVRLSEELKEGPALCFINRGFVSIISEPLTENFDEVLLNISKQVIDICPTGALGRLENFDGKQ